MFSDASDQKKKMKQRKASAEKKVQMFELISVLLPAHTVGVFFHSRAE